MGAGLEIAKQLSAATNSKIDLLGTIPIDPQVRLGGDSGEPIILSHPDAPASKAIKSIANTLSVMPRGLVGQTLKIDPV
jgi:ATP-binding protein involved in chromosome partitioning